MLVTINSALLLASGVAIGFLISTFGHRLIVRKSGAIADAKEASMQPESAEAGQLHRMMTSLDELTSHVGTQVGQHSLRVTEISNSIENPVESGSTILTAGKTLIEANRILQVELDAARKEIEIQRGQLASSIREAQTDALTSLPNRRALENEMSRMLARQRRGILDFSLMLIDIDHFKQVNDRYGHMVGDHLLKSIARRLASAFRDSDFVARYGGEEFIVILPKTSGADGCKAMERIRRKIVESPFKIGELELPITASLGLKEAVTNETGDDLFKKVDQALYAAKSAGRNCCFYHDGTMCQKYVPVVQPSAIDAGELTPLFGSQPEKVDSGESGPDASGQNP